MISGIFLIFSKKYEFFQLIVICYKKLKFVYIKNYNTAFILTNHFFSWENMFSGAVWLNWILWIAQSRQSNADCAGSCQLFLIQSTSRDSRPPRVSRMVTERRIWIRTCQMSERAGDLRRALSLSHRSVCPTLAPDPAAINKRDETSRAGRQSRCRAECIGFCQTNAETKTTTTTTTRRNRWMYRAKHALIPV